MKYEGNKRKLDESNRKETQNTNDAEILRRMDLETKPEHVLKTAKTVQLIKKYNFTFGIVSTPFDSRIIIIEGGPNQVGGGGGGGAG